MKKTKGKNIIQKLLIIALVLGGVAIFGLITSTVVFAGVDQNGDGAMDPYETCLGSAAGASCTPAWYSFCNTRVDPKCSSKPAFCTDGVLWGRDSQRVCVAKGKCTDNDKDGIETCVPSKDAALPPVERRDDCDDKDPWSHRYASANIQSVVVDFEPSYVQTVKSNKNYTPKSPYNLLDSIKATVTFNKKCGMKPPGPNDALSKPMNVSIVKGDGTEIPIVDTIYNKYDQAKGVYMDYVFEMSVNLQEIMTEEAIAAIAKNPGWRLKFVGPDLVDDFRGAVVPPNVTKDTPKYQPLPMTNCAQTYGSGRHKVVYMRGQSANLGATSLLDKVSLTVNKGFRIIEPYKTNVDAFSFFTDLRNHYDSTWRDRIANITMPGPQVFPEISSVSSCGKFGSVYIGLIKMPALKIKVGLLTRLLPVGGIASQRGKHILMDPEQMFLFEMVVVHEFSHVFGGLFDESAPAKKAFMPAGIDPANCSYNPSSGYFFSGRIYGSLNAEGCAHGLSDQNGKKLYRPSIDSLMNDHGGWGVGDKFNVVSCGYLLKAIKKGSSAHSYFPECAAMPGIIPVGQ